jgi:hypothetical protein
MNLPLKDAKFCVNCNTIFTEKSCPSCARENYIFMSQWLPEIKTPESYSPTRKERIEWLMTINDEAWRGEHG